MLKIVPKGVSDISIDISKNDLSKIQINVSREILQANHSQCAIMSLTGNFEQGAKHFASSKTFLRL